MTTAFDTTYILEREAIVDALYRALEGYDNGDEKVFESAWFEDAKFILGETVIPSYKAIRDHAVEKVFPKDTLHQVTNLRVDFEPGSKTGSLSANATASHAMPGEGIIPDGNKFTSYCKYLVEVEKDDSCNLWKIKILNLKMILLEGTPSIMM